MPFLPTIKTQHTAPPDAAPRHHAEDLDDMARRLTATGDYKVLRRLVPRPLSPAPADGSHKTGIVLDVETTGLDATKDEIVELAMVEFRYSHDGAVTGVSDIFKSFNQPSIPVPAEITKLTGITDAMVVGQRIDGAAVEAFVADAGIIIAHHAAFDRKFAERIAPVFAEKPWACSASEIDWKRYGFSGAKLSYLISEAGFFHAAHRAIDDCHAVIELLSQPLPGTSNTALSVLLEHARRKTYRIWAEYSPYHLKDILKRRGGYRWNDGADGSPRSWYVDVDEGARDAELKFLKTEIFQRDVELRCTELTARERFSARIGARQVEATAASKWRIRR